ncbi:hypothetical protein [Leeuwenhoekiella nanhaiensis]|uniref:PepSY domain-containing protein n=1 Tax=Leeuwenhoekiella nanhaiensis TaxID=1655491 RepID=A0A2G1VSM0_9FLAO|nr:hypothetical protein [Leeuwenhoekiella nanhaiensis]PHQ29783.1 hypothetical protein CJ305_07365 [Leeuwenhoekiella nanhaiensis]
MKYPILALFITLSCLAHAQNLKQEFEQGIEAKGMPEAAITYLQSLEGTKKRLQYYREQDGERQSFEAKFKLNGEKYSVEFDQTGMLEDIEIIRTQKEMGATLTAVKNYLETSFERHRIEKIQAHYEPKTVFNTANPGIPDAWELIVATKNTENKLERFEMTFDADGNFLKSRKIVRRSYEFLLF